MLPQRSIHTVLSCLTPGCCQHLFLLCDHKCCCEERPCTHFLTCKCLEWTCWAGARSFVVFITTVKFLNPNSCSNTRARAAGNNGAARCWGLHTLSSRLFFCRLPRGLGLRAASLRTLLLSPASMNSSAPLWPHSLFSHSFLFSVALGLCCNIL